MPETATLIRHYPWHPKLGRHQVLDPRSLDHVHDGSGVKLKTADHEPPLAVLDQEDLHAQGIDVRTLFPHVRGVKDVDALGSCVGNATTAHLSERVGLSKMKLADPNDTKAGEVFAINRYHRATEFDEQFFREYPTDDTGSSGLGSAKACKRDGLISGYVHATTLQGFLSLLQSGTAILGVPWFNAWFEPDSNGFVDAGGPNVWASSGLAGGHEICATAIEALVFTATGDIDLDKTVIRYRNSWAKSFADNGSFRMRAGTYVTLRPEIDIIQFHR